MIVGILYHLRKTDRISNENYEKHIICLRLKFLCSDDSISQDYIVIYVCIMAFRDGKLNRNTVATEAHVNLIPKYNR